MFSAGEALRHLLWVAGGLFCVLLQVLRQRPVLGVVGGGSFWCLKFLFLGIFGVFVDALCDKSHRKRGCAGPWWSGTVQGT